MDSRNIKMTIMYDGSGYLGWQRLGKSRSKESIQGCIEKVLSDTLNEQVKIIGSSRTDQGVHAYAGIANFHTTSSMSLEEIKEELNLKLLEDIRITKLEEVSKQFHSRYSAKSKTYIYRIDNNDKANVFVRKYSYHHKDKLDIDKMQSAAEYFVGIHDFIGFSSPMKDNRTTVREIYSLTVKKEVHHKSYQKNNNQIIITVKGNGFLYNMVRIIVGTLIQVGEGKKKPGEMKNILDSKDRSLTGPKAEYQGLILKEIEY